MDMCNGDGRRPTGAFATRSSALRRGDYEEVPRLAPTADGMADWPAGQQAGWRAWVDLAYMMRGQRDHERRERDKAGRGLRNWGGW